MSQRIIGRRMETEILMNCVNSSKPEFVAVYGRRRVGKTFLVKKLLGSRFCFYMTGVYECPKSELLVYFQEQLLAYSGRRGLNQKHGLRHSRSCVTICQNSLQRRCSWFLLMNCLGLIHQNPTFCERSTCFGTDGHRKETTLNSLCVALPQHG